MRWIKYCNFWRQPFAFCLRFITDILKEVILNFGVGWECHYMVFEAYCKISIDDLILTFKRYYMKGMFSNLSKYNN